MRIRVIPLFLLTAISIHAQTREQRVAASAFIDAFVTRSEERIIALAHPMYLGMVKPDELIGMSSALERDAGPFVRDMPLSSARRGPYWEIVHRAWYAKDSIDFRLMVDSLNLIEGFWTDLIKHGYTFAPPLYNFPEYYREMDIRVPTARDSLPATISIPNGPGPFAAVLLVQDLGPHDRDMTVKGNKPFRDIAWGLASRGILVLRMDRRTRVHPDALDPRAFTVREEMLDDAVAAVRYLKSRKDVDSMRLSVAGLGLGGTVAPLIAAAEPAVKAIALLSAPARPLEEVLKDQFRAVAAMKGPPQEAERKALEKQLALMDALAARKIPQPIPVMSLPAVYYYDLRDRDPVRVARTLSIPMLVLRAGKDYQVQQKDFDVWRDALSSHANVVFMTCEDCFHLLIEVRSGASPDNYEVEKNVAFPVIESLSRFIKRK